MNSIVIAALAMLIGLPATACATSVQDRTVADLYRESEYVVEGSADNVRGACEAANCLTKYSIRVKRSLKSQSQKEVIDVCMNQPITLGETYFFFIGLQRVELGEKIVCDYVAFVDGVFIEGVQGNFYRYMSIDGTNRSVLLDGRKFQTYLVEEPRFLESVAERTKGEKGSE